MRAHGVGQVRCSGISSPAVLALALALTLGIFLTGREAAAQYGTQRTPITAPASNSGPTNPTTSAQPGSVVPPVEGPGMGSADPGFRAHLEAERVKAVNDDRHNRLVSDVDKLISLTNELKADVDKANKDELSVDVIRKAQQIEKLAHDVQNRMKN